MSATSYKLDQTHMGVRLALLGASVLTLVVSLFLAGYVVSTILYLTGLSATLLIVIAALAITFGVARLLEHYLINHWPSGRTLEMSEEGLALCDRIGAPVKIDWDKRISLTKWYFVVRKSRAWVPKGSYCVACEIKQNDKSIIPYVFMKPAAAQAMRDWPRFEVLLARSGDSKQNQHHDLAAIGSQARLRSAEHDRWLNGVEMTILDFVALIEELNNRMPDAPGGSEDI